MVVHNNTYATLTQTDIAALQQRVEELEQQIREQENLEDYAAFFTHALDMLCIAGFDGYFKHLNPRWSETLGYTNEELLSHPFMDFVHPDDCIATQTEAEKLAAVGTDTISFENRYRCKDGTYKYLRWTSRAVPERQCIYATARDITSEKQVQEQLQRLNDELHQSQFMLQGLIDNAPAIIYAKAVDRKLWAVNRQFCTFMHLEPEQMLGKTDYDLFPTDTADMFYKQEDQILHSGHPIGEEQEFADADGQPRYYWNVKFPIYDDQHQIIGLAGIAADITERKQQEEEVRRLNAELEQRVAQQTAQLHQNQVLLQGILDHSPAVIHIKDIEGRYMLVSHTYEKLFHMQNEQVVGTTDYDIFPYEVAQQNRINDQAVATARHAVESEELIPIDGETRVYLTAKFPLINEQGEVYATGGISTDITERKRQEEELRIFKTVVENATEGIGVIKVDGTFTYANPTLYDMLQYGSDLMGTNTLGIYDEPPDKITGIMQYLISKKNWHGELIYKRKDGSTFPGLISAFAISDEQGTVQAMSGIIRDQTEQKRHEETLQRLVAVIENSSEFIGIANPDGYVIYLNKAGKHLVGIENEETFRQIQMIDYFPPEEQERVQHDIMPILMRDGCWKGECLFRHFQTGKTIPVEWNVFVIKNNDTGQPIAIATVTRDLRDQKRVEAERTALQQQIIDAQRAALRELSSPLIPISEQVVIMPLIGTIDTQRAQQIMETLLDGVARHRANTAIVDITGVQVVDTQVADALIRAAKAVKLLGAEVILTGIGPAMAQTLVTLGVDMQEITTLATLQTGISFVMRNL